MKTRSLLTYVALAWLWLAPQIRADVTPNPLFSDNAVLQRDKIVPVWGTAAEGEKVIVEFAGQKLETVAKDGRWKVELQPMPASAEPRTMTITGNNTVTAKDVLVGEVWVCSGQSNMEWALKDSTGGPEAVAASADPLLRIMRLPHRASDEPQATANGKWSECTPDSVPDFSGVAYFFGRELRKELKVPVGLIGSYYGGTPAAAWTDHATLEGNPDLKKILDDQAKKVAEFDPAKMEPVNKKNAADYEAALAKAQADGTKKPGKPVVLLPPKIDHRRPACLYNGMIAPLQPYAIRGVIWYQGETDNGGDGPNVYRKLFPALIGAWRAQWQQGDFPFFFCQIAPHEKMRPEIREAQFLTWKSTPKTAMAVTTDVGNAEDIHPRDKEPVGHRLALAARALAYGEKLEYSGPEFDLMTVAQSRAIVRFKHVGSGLMAKDGDLKGFTIAGADGKFVPAKAEIKGDIVEVFSSEVPAPAAVRYGWANVPEVNLYNKDGLPASPFRTDAECASEPPAEPPRKAKELINYFLPMPIRGELSGAIWGAKDVGPRDPDNGLEDKSLLKWCYWDGQILKGSDGKYHLFACRWDEARGHGGWKESVAIYAVSDHVMGPYTDKGLCWPENQGGKACNVVALIMPDGRYAITISSTRPPEVFASKSPDGPWESLGRITVEGRPDWFGYNVTPILRPDGRYQFVQSSGELFVSENITGPYKSCGPSVYWEAFKDVPRKEWDMEDPVIWHSGGLYHMVVNRWNHRKAYHLTSKDGMTGWVRRGVAYDPTTDFLRYTDGTVNHWHKIERPGVVIENGHVNHFLLSVIDVRKELEKGNDRHGSKIIVVPFDGEAMDRDLAEITKREDSQSASAHLPTSAESNPTGSAASTQPSSSRAAPNANHPQILYWVWPSVPTNDDRYVENLDRIAAKTPFTHVAIYLHDGFGFDDPAKVKPALAKAVARAHQLGLKIIVSPYFPAHSPAQLKGRLSGMVLDSEAVLDSKGATTIEVRAEALREKKPAASSLLKAYAFHKTGDGFYAPATLRELSGDAVHVTPLGADALRIEVKQGAEHAGETVFVLTRHDYPYGDLFSDFWPEQFKNMLDTWADIPLDGVALDEFRYLTVNMGKPFRGRWYSAPMAKAYGERFNRSLEEDLFANRYAPEGQPGKRAAAINRYFDLLGPRPAEIDGFFMEYARKLFGPGIFQGFHNTWHNSLAGDEIWGTGVNWWGLDRAYGQTDETMPVPLRLGIGAAYPKPIFYNMFYSAIARGKKLNEQDSYIEEAVAEARLNGRVNYLGLDQPKEWGIPFDDALLERIGRVERRIRLLNIFNGPRPDTRLLVLFGYPSLVNWFPAGIARNNYDINGSLKAEEKAAAIWESGIPCALASSSVIDSGKLTIGADGRPVINGHRFDAVVFIGPEYSKPSTLAFLRKYVEEGGKLLLDGEATRGFDGNPIGTDYAAIVKAAVAHDCTPTTVAKLGLVSNWPKDGSRLEDGSVLMVDRATIETDNPHTFSFRIGSHEFTVVASGVMAFKATPDGQPQKLAAAQFISLARDGQFIISREHPADAVIEWTSGGLRSLLSAQQVGNQHDQAVRRHDRGVK